jgi:hypothetical protein
MSLFSYKGFNTLTLDEKITALDFAIMNKFIPPHGFPKAILRNEADHGLIMAEGQVNGWGADPDRCVQRRQRSGREGLSKEGNYAPERSRHSSALRLEACMGTVTLTGAAAVRLYLI